MARNEHITLILGMSHIIRISVHIISLHCIFCLVLRVYSRISPIFLVSRLNRHGGDSDLSYLSLFSLFWCFRVKSSFSDTPANSEPDSDQCTQALASCMDDLNTGIATQTQPAQPTGSHLPSPVSGVTKPCHCVEWRQSLPPS